MRLNEVKERDRHTTPSMYAVPCSSHATENHYHSDHLSNFRWITWIMTNFIKYFANNTCLCQHTFETKASEYQNVINSIIWAELKFAGMRDANKNVHSTPISPTQTPEPMLKLEPKPNKIWKLWRCWHNEMQNFDNLSYEAHNKQLCIKWQKMSKCLRS